MSNQPNTTEVVRVSETEIPRPSRRQIVFNWIMADDVSRPDGWWGGSDEVKDVDELLAALDAEHSEAIATAEALIRDLAETLGMFIDGEACRLDHHGYCQAHRLGNPCEQIVAREVLAPSSKGATAVNKEGEFFAGIPEKLQLNSSPARPAIFDVDLLTVRSTLMNCSQYMGSISRSTRWSRRIHAEVESAIESIDIATRIEINEKSAT